MRVSISLAAGIIFLLIKFTPVHAESSCASVDYRAELGEPRDQGNTGVCYSKTTADLASQVLGVRIASVGIAKSYLGCDPRRLAASPDPEIAQYLKENPRVIGEIEEGQREERANLHADTIMAYTKTASATADAISYKGLFNIGGNEEHALLMSNLDGFCRAENLPANGDAAYMRYSDAAGKFIRKAIPSDRDTCPGRQGGGSAKNVRALSGVAAKSFGDWVDGKCGDRIKPAKPLIPIHVSIAGDVDDLREKLKSGKLGAKDRKKIFDEIDRNLNRHRVSAIGYDYNEHTGKKVSEPHSAIIAARKMIGGQCRYFLRNSFGKSCADYARKFRKNPVCEEAQGGIWLRKEDLKSIYGVVSVK